MPVAIILKNSDSEGGKFFGVIGTIINLVIYINALEEAAIPAVILLGTLSLFTAPMLTGD
jgi:hypothetical protein